MASPETWVLRHRAGRQQQKDCASTCGAPDVEEVVIAAGGELGAAGGPLQAAHLLLMATQHPSDVFPDPVTHQGTVSSLLMRTTACPPLLYTMCWVPHCAIGKTAPPRVACALHWPCNVLLGRSALDRVMHGTDATMKRVHPSSIDLMHNCDCSCDERTPLRWYPKQAHT